MITEKVNLLEGVIYEGKTYKSLVMRAPIVKDSIDAEEQSNGKGVLHLSLSLLANMIVSFGPIPKDEINADLLIQLNEEDLDRLNQVRDCLKKKVHWSSES